MSTKTTASETSEIGAPAKLRLRLYVAGDSPNSVMAVANLKHALVQVPGGIDLEIVDILVEPERCIGDGVLMTPTLVKLAPTPERRILGNLSQREALLGVLGLLTSGDSAVGGSKDE